MAKTRISKEFSIEGEIQSEELVEVEGSVRGRVYVKGNDLRVRSGGVVEAEVEASSVHVEGELRGNVFAGEILFIYPSGKFEGAVKTARIQIADGAVFKGNIDMIER